VYRDKHIAVVVPAYKEEVLIEVTFDSIPDSIHTVDDGSPERIRLLIDA